MSDGAGRGVPPVSVCKAQGLRHQAPLRNAGPVRPLPGAPADLPEKVGGADSHEHDQRTWGTGERRRWPATCGRRGYTLLASQWRCRFGELDLVARDRQGTVCFVEVKLRRRRRHGSAPGGGGRAGSSSGSAQRGGAVSEPATSWTPPPALTWRRSIPTKTTAITGVEYLERRISMISTDRILEREDSHHEVSTAHGTAPCRLDGGGGHRRWD